MAGNGRAYKRGKIWWIAYCVSGEELRESAKTRRKEEAEALLRDRLQSIFEGRFFPARKRHRDMTVGKLRDLWLAEAQHKESLRHDKTRLGAVVEILGTHTLVSSLTPDDVSKLRDKLAAKPRAIATVNRHLAVLHSALALASERGHQHRNPMRGVKLGAEDNARNRIATPDEYAKLCAAAPGELRALIRWGYWSGMRLGEIVGLRRDRIDKQARLLRLDGRATKEGEIKAVPIPSEVFAEIDALPVRLDGRLFALKANAYSVQFSRLCAALKIEDLTYHDLRHTALTNLRRAGVDIVTMRAISGHKTLAMLERYNAISEDDLTDAMTKVEAHMAKRAADHAAGKDSR